MAEKGGQQVRAAAEAAAAVAGEPGAAFSRLPGAGRPLRARVLVVLARPAPSARSTPPGPTAWAACGSAPRGGRPGAELRGRLLDQAALLGVLTTHFDLGLPLLSVDSRAAPGPPGGATGPPAGPQ